MPKPPPFSKLVDQIRSLDCEAPDQAALALHALNQYFFQRSDGVPGYFSAFHAWWEANHESVLSLEIDRDACRRVAEVLISTRNNREDVPWKKNIALAGIPKAHIANVRFFTVVQDFKIDLYKDGRNPYRDAMADPLLFNAKELTLNPSLVDHNLRYLGAQGSQGDKRRAWMLEQAKYLMAYHGGDAFTLLDAHGGDAACVRHALATRTGLGFKEKKADLFLRDMADFGVWQYVTGADQINVASDYNTMRVALRTGILKGRTPLLSSLLDIHSYQYALVDRLTQAAWRIVWEEWGKISEPTQPPTPASLDFVIYQGIGKTYCKKTARCKRDKGCPFDSHCPQHLRRLQPPKSISQVGMTSWASAETDDGGGLGLSS